MKASNRRQRRIFMSSTILLALLALLNPAEAQRPSLRGSGASQNSTRSTTAASKEVKTTPAGTTQFAIDSFSPKGFIKDNEIISVTFTADVMSQKDFEAGNLPDAVFSFEPDIEGTVQWESPRMAKFAPARPLRKGTEYVVRINPLLTSAAGTKLGKTPEYKFQTEALSLRSARQKQFATGRRAIIGLEFSDQVRPEELKKYLTLQEGENDIKWTPQSNVASASINIVTDSVSSDTLTLSLKPGLAGVSGPLGLRNPIERTVKLDFLLTARRITSQWVDGKPEVIVFFSDSPSTEDVEKFVSIEPPVKVSYDSSSSRLILRGPFQPETRYTVSIKEGFLGSGKMTLEPIQLSTWIPKMAPFLSIQNLGPGYLGSQGGLKLHLRSAAVTTVTVSAHKVYENNLVSYLNQHNGNRYGVQSLARKVAQKTFTLPDSPNQALETTVDLRELLGKDVTGFYGFHLQGESSQDQNDSQNDDYYYYDYEAYRSRNLSRGTRINISNMGIVSKKGADRVYVYVAALDTAQPMAGIKVSLYSSLNQLLGEGVTNADGSLEFTNLDIRETAREKPAVVLAKNESNNDIALLNINETLSHMSAFNETSDGRSFLKDGYEAFLTPERGAFRPGETVHISGFIRGRDGSPPGKAFPIEAVITRPDSKEMTPQIVQVSESGLISFDVTIPGYAPTGYYKVDVKMPGSTEAEYEEAYSENY